MTYLTDLHLSHGPFFFRPLLSFPPSPAGYRYAGPQCSEPDAVCEGDSERSRGSVHQDTYRLRLHPALGAQDPLVPVNTHLLAEITVLCTRYTHMQPWCWPHTLPGSTQTPNFMNIQYSTHPVHSKCPHTEHYKTGKTCRWTRLWCVSNPRNQITARSPSSLARAQLCFTRYPFICNCNMLGQPQKVFNIYFLVCCVTKGLSKIPGIFLAWNVFSIFLKKRVIYELSLCPSLYDSTSFWRLL